jgi:glucose/arabinose dehydrogenase
MRYSSVAFGLLVLPMLGCDGGGSGDGSMMPPPPPPPPVSGIEVTRVYAALAFANPVLAVQAPGDDTRWFVVEQAGRVLAFDNLPTAASTSVFIDISGRVQDGGERGLLGMAFDRQFATNGRVFLHYTRDSGQLQSVLAAYTSPDGGVTLDPASESILLTVDQPFDNHNGGHLAFGPDGMLYMALGDGGSGGDPQDNAQDTHNLLGKILRIDVSSGTDYTVPTDNRWAGNAPCTTGTGAAECPEIHAYGLRNPWRFSFDVSTGDLWVGDVGQNDWEEVDRVFAGGNYGWRFREGAHCFNPPSGCPTQSGGDALIDPDAEYDHGLGGSVTGGYVYRGAGVASLLGRYVFGDFISGRIFAHTPGSGDSAPEQLLDTSLSISSFAEGENGELYIVDYDGGLYRIDAA